MGLEENIKKCSMLEESHIQEYCSLKRKLVGSCVLSTHQDDCKVKDMQDCGHKRPFPIASVLTSPMLLLVAVDERHTMNRSGHPTETYSK